MAIISVLILASPDTPVLFYIKADSLNFVTSVVLF